MKILIAFMIGACALTGCTYKPHEKRLSKFNNNSGQILKSFYKKNADTIEFRRFLLRDSSLLIQKGKIFLGEYALQFQRITSVDLLKNNKRSIDSLTDVFAMEGLVERFTDDRDVMFIQIVPDSDMGTLNELGFLNLRQSTEGIIDERLKANKSGEWYAGDMGVGGNMLFFIDDWDKAILSVTILLTDEDLIDHVLIAKQIMMDNDDWRYEVVYPLEYEGVFNEM